MKRKILGIIAAVAIVMVVGYNMYTSLNKSAKLSHLILANVEALADIESLDPGENGNYSCTVSVDCGWPLMGAVSCTGIKCSRGLDFWNGAYVECNGNRTHCS